MGNKPERRELQFNSLDDAVADVERLAKGPVRTTGNHSFGQIIEHLARTHDMATGKVQVPAPPFLMKLMLTLFKSRILSDKPLAPGVKLPKQSEAFFWPDQEFDVHEASARLKVSVENYKSNGPLENHPIFGNVTRAQNESLNCRHCAMHLSFVHPVENV